MASVIFVVHLGLLRIWYFQRLIRTVTSVLSVASQPAGENYSCVRQSTQELEKSRDSQNGDSLGGGVIESHYDDGRILKRLGCDSKGQSCERRVASAAESQTYKLFRVASSG